MLHLTLEGCAMLKIQLPTALALFYPSNQVITHINNPTFHGDMEGFPEQLGADAVPAVTTPTPLLIFLPAFICERASLQH